MSAPLDFVYPMMDGDKQNVWVVYYRLLELGLIDHQFPPPQEALPQEKQKSKHKNQKKHKLKGQKKNKKSEDDELSRSHVEDEKKDQSEDEKENQSEDEIPLNVNHSKADERNEENLDNPSSRDEKDQENAEVGMNLKKDNEEHSKKEIVEDQNEMNEDQKENIPPNQIQPEMRRIRKRQLTVTNLEVKPFSSFVFHNLMKLLHIFKSWMRHWKRKSLLIIQPKNEK